jgi:glycosyltransferase involved in cell wall biosynthesis
MTDRAHRGIDAGRGLGSIGEPRGTPRASVVIATYNRRHLLAEVLRALGRQSIPLGSFEVVFVDDGSQDGTAEWLATLTLPFDHQVLRQTNQGPSAARNAGIRVSRGDIVVLLDDDLVPDPDLLREHLRIHDSEEGVVVIGPALSLPHYRQPWIAWQQATLERAYDAMARGDIEPSFRQFWSGNCSVAREQVVAVGGFDPSLRFNEDVELGYRLMSRGLHFRFNASATGLHHSSRSFAGWSATHRAYGQLDVGLFRRLGEDAMYQLLAGDWSRRHPLTRWLVRRTVGRRGRLTIATGVLGVCVRVGTLVPMSRFSHAVCAALANMLYWDGVTQELGHGAALCATLEAGEHRA